MEIHDINIFLCMHAFFYGTFTCASTNNLEAANAADSSIAHTLWKKIKTLKRRRERE